MSWLKGMGRWCGLGIAVTLVGTAAVIGVRVVEQQLPATLLGPGAQAKSFRVHWTKSTAYAEDIQFPLEFAKDHTDNPLRLRAEKMWLAFNSDAWLRKRFVFPHVLIQGAVISPASLDGLAAQSIVDISTGQATDIDFAAGPAVEFDEPTEQPKQLTRLVSSIQLTPDQLLSSEPTPFLALPFGGAVSDLSPSDRAAIRDAQVVPQQQSLVWLEQVNQILESLTSSRFASGRQVAIDADMVTEQLQKQFESLRQQSQRLVNEARDLQMQLSGMDNVLRHDEQLRQCLRRLESIFEELKQQRFVFNGMGKRLDERQAALRSQSIEERYELHKAAAGVEAPNASEIAELILNHGLADELVEPERLAIVLADLVRKPYRFQQAMRGQQIRPSSKSQPEFAAHSTKIEGTVALSGRVRPFEAHGRFLLAAMSSTEHEPLPVAIPAKVAGSDAWQMSIDMDAYRLQLEAHSLAAASGAVAVELTSSSTSQLELQCQILAGEVSTCAGQLRLREWLEGERWQDSTRTMARAYQHSQLLLKYLEAAPSTAESLPEVLSFSVATVKKERRTKIDSPAVQWLRGQLERLAKQEIEAAYQHAGTALDQLVVEKLTMQKGLLATLRRDAEAKLNSQLEEMYRIQSTINTLIEQRSGSQMARQRMGAETKR